MFFGFLSVTVMGANDEGYYLTSAKMVYQGQIPYLDFFYTQTPYLPYIHGLWLKVIGNSWLTARVPDVIFSAALGTILYQHACAEDRNRRVGIWSVILFAGSYLVLHYYPLAKTYSLTALLLFASYRLIAIGTREGSNKHILVAGVLAGIAVGARLLCLAPVPVLFILSRKKYSPWLLAGGVLALLPCLLIFAQDPELFMFNNLGFHAVRSDAGLVGNLSQKLSALTASIGVYHAETSLPIQNGVLLVLLLGGAAYRKLERGALAIGVVLILVSVMPTPMFTQYFCLSIPFLIAAVGPYLRDVCHSEERTRLLNYLLVPYLFATVIGIGTATGMLSPSGFGKPVHMSLSNLRGITQLIEKHSSPGDIVFSSWPGYLQELDRKMLPGAENNFPHELSLGDRLSQREANQYNILTDAQIADAIREKKVDLAIVGLGMKDLEAARKRHRLLLDSGYKLVSRERGVGIYVR